MYLITKNKLLFVLIITILILLHVIWDYTHGGVPVHHILADENMPGVSNWWGCITIPILSWLLLSLTQKRIQKIPHQSNSIVGFVTSICLGIFISILWEIRMENLIPYVICFPVVFSVIKRVHYPEYLLGFILGLVYTFGGILPLAIGAFLYIMSFLVWNLFKKVIPFLFSKVF